MKVLGRVVAVLCLIHLQNMAFLGLKRRLRRPIPTLASMKNTCKYRVFWMEKGRVSVESSVKRQHWQSLTRISQGTRNAP